MNKQKKIHNIVASAVLASGFRHIEKEFLTSIRGYLRPSPEDEKLFYDMQAAGRRAMEKILLEDSKSYDPIEEARTSLQQWITGFVPEEGKQLRILGYAEQYVGDRCYKRFYKRIWRSDEEIFVEYSDFIPEEKYTKAGSWHSDTLDSFSLDEYAEIIQAIKQESKTEELTTRYCDGSAVAVGDRVRWNDPSIDDYDDEDRQMMKDRIWTVWGVCGDIVKIGTPYSDADTFVHELIPVQHTGDISFKDPENAAEYVKTLADTGTERKLNGCICFGKGLYFPSDLAEEAGLGNKKGPFVFTTDEDLLTAINWLRQRDGYLKVTN